VAKYYSFFYLDYGGTFSLVVKMAFVRLFIAMTTFQQLDVKDDFLNGDVKEEIYMEEASNFFAQGESFGLVCHLRKSLYGLKQSYRA